MEVFWVVIFVDLIFIAIAYLVNKDNAKYLVAGYNRMSIKEREKFDLNNFLIFWKKFFVNLTISSTLIYVISFFIFNGGIATLIWSAALILPWPIFIYKAQKFLS
tara:strand:+ start:451 stop:765 length:315 start_codon:yes stop_codon:yes gene_type:complete